MSHFPLTDPITAAESLRITTRRLSKMVETQQVPHVQLPGGEIRFDVDSLAQWASQLTIPVAEVEDFAHIPSN